ncbi:MAG: hypothetical protein PHW60_15595 [Kiritimatiellae bacterium]|nr:hypothetical protein [Kiritimatiellia bacterium]
MKTLLLTELYSYSPHRPAGYAEDVISYGKVDGNSLILSDEAYKQLTAKYAPSGEVPETVLSKERREICEACDQAKDQAFVCRLFEGCCFGQWRTQFTSQCPASPPKWPAITASESPPHGP